MLVSCWWRLHSNHAHSIPLRCTLCCRNTETNETAWELPSAATTSMPSAIAITPADADLPDREMMFRVTGAAGTPVQNGSGPAPTFQQMYNRLVDALQTDGSTMLFWETARAHRQYGVFEEPFFDWLGAQVSPQGCMYRTMIGVTHIGPGCTVQGMLGVGGHRWVPCTALRPHPCIAQLLDVFTVDCCIGTARSLRNLHLERNSRQRTTCATAELLLCSCMQAAAEGKLDIFFDGIDDDGASMHLRIRSRLSNPLLRQPAPFEF